MSPLVLPGEPPPIDRSKAGLLQIAPAMLGPLLRLPPGQEVIGCAVLPSGNLSLIVVGRGMFKLDQKGNPLPVTLILENERRPHAIKPQEYEVRTLAWWNHNPGEKWLFFDWQPEARLPPASGA